MDCLCPHASVFRRLCSISSCAAAWKINANITLDWWHKQFIITIHTLFHFSHDKINPHMAIKWRFSQIDYMSHSLCCVVLMTSLSIADDVVMQIYDPLITMQAREKRYRTRKILIILTVGRANRVIIDCVIAAPNCLVLIKTYLKLLVDSAQSYGCFYCIPHIKLSSPSYWSEPIYLHIIYQL